VREVLLDRVAVAQQDAEVGQDVLGVARDVGVLVDEGLDVGVLAVPRAADERVELRVVEGLDVLAEREVGSLAFNETFIMI
jgi:hypothetical protein